MPVVLRSRAVLAFRLGKNLFTIKLDDRDTSSATIVK